MFTLQQKRVVPFNIDYPKTGIQCICYEEHIEICRNCRRTIFEKEFLTMNDKY